MKNSNCNGKGNQNKQNKNKLLQRFQFVFVYRLRNTNHLALFVQLLTISQLCCHVLCVYLVCVFVLKNWRRDKIQSNYTWMKKSEVILSLITRASRIVIVGVEFLFSYTTFKTSFFLSNWKDLKNGGLLAASSHQGSLFTLDYAD